MNFIIEHLEQIWFGIVFISCSAIWTSQWILFSLIKKTDHAKWVDIGEPGIETSLSSDFSKFRKALLTLKYIFNGDVTLDRNHKIKNLQEIVKVTYISSAILILLFVVFAFLFDHGSNY